MRFRQSIVAPSTVMQIGRILASFLIMLLSAGFCSAQIPTVYQDLYTQLNGDINDFQGNIAGKWNGSTYPVAFSAQLTNANSNNGPGLLQPASFTLIQTEIQYLKTLGVKAISVEVSFPMLYAPFFNSIGQPAYQSQFATFYANVAAAIRAQGLKVIVESQSMIPTGLQSVWGAGLQDYYASLTTFQDYMTARAATAKIVAQTMQPDFFVLQEEPDTESNQSGQAMAGTVAGSTAMLNGSLAAARQANVPGMKLGAGFGSWLQAFQSFANSFTQQNCGPSQPCLTQPLDFLDLHVFPILEHTPICSPPPNSVSCTAPNFWQNAVSTVNTANSAKVPITISQCWLRKVRENEWPPVGGLGDIQEAREAYSFWEPLDLLFLQTIYNLANYAHMLFVVPFNTQNYAAYLTWSASTALQGEGGSSTPAQVFSAVQSAGNSAVAAMTFSTVGTGYHNLIAPTPTPTIALATAGQVEPFAPQTIVTAYGTNLTVGTADATPPLSTTLDGTTVTVKDSAGTSRLAFLFYVSPVQINFEIPEGTALGTATVSIKSANGTTQNANIIIANLSPGLFQLNASGLVAAWVLPVVSGVQQNLQPVYQSDVSMNIIALPIDLGSSTEQAYLELYGTGIRNAKNVTVTVGGLSVPVLFVGAAPGFDGLDQVNIGPLPRALAGQGSVNLILTADGQTAKMVNLSFK